MFRYRHHAAFVIAVAVSLTGAAAWASQLTQQQQAWLDATLTHLYGSVGQAPDGAADRFTHLILEHNIMLQAPDPLGSDDNLVPNMSEASCNALATSIRNKVTECNGYHSSLQTCLDLFSETEDPFAMCKSQQDLFDTCMDVLKDMSVDYSKYCGS